MTVKIKLEDYMELLASEIIDLKDRVSLLEKERATPSDDPESPPLTKDYSTQEKKEIMNKILKDQAQKLAEKKL